MRKFLFPAIACLCVLGFSPSWAWSHISGNINSIDPNTREFTLDDGTTYKLMPDINLSDLTVGDRVTINAETRNGQNVVDEVIKSS